MNLGNLPITSLLNATEHQFQNFYAQPPSNQKDDCTKEAYITSFKKRQIQALADDKTLKELKSSSQEIATKLIAIFSEAKQKFENDLEALLKKNGNKPLKSGLVTSLSCVIDNTLKISGFGLRYHMEDECDICDFEVDSPAISITIENLQTKESVSFPELTAHFISAHHYFSIPTTKYHLDPTKLYRVLCLPINNVEDTNNHTKKI